MTDSVFDTALDKRFTEAPLISTISVTSNDTLLIYDLETGSVMRLPVSVLNAALGSAFASLVGGKVPASQLPSYVDDVLEYANAGAFPATGETGKIYVSLATNVCYRWSGSSYVEISASLALGETSSTAYRGDRGKTAYDHSQITGNPHGTTKSDIGLSNVDNTSDANKPVSTPQQNALNLKANKSQENWQDVSFLNSWVNFGDPYNLASFFKDEFGIVHLKGLIGNGTMYESAFVLPEGYRPPKNGFFPTLTQSGAGGALIGSDGTVKPWYGSNVWFSLEGISFRV